MLNQTVNATIRPEQVADQRWDVIVIGAGPAGSMAARELAKAKARVLLVDSNSFPRRKVCGCCINGAAIDVLTQAGLEQLLPQLHAQRLDAFHLAHAGRSARVRLDHGVSLSREKFDTALIQAAIDEGAEFLDQAMALIGKNTSDAREVSLKIKSDEIATRSKAVVVAGGLGSHVFAERGSDERQVARSSRVGAGTTLENVPPDYKNGTIYMSCDRSGYVGLVRLEDNQLDIAAALDANAIKKHGGIPQLVEQILTRSRLPVPSALHDANWHGTPKLTQHRQNIAAERCFFVGDAAGYIEPFTGEGIAWALASGRAVAPLAMEFIQNNGDLKIMRAWTKTHRELILKRSKLCQVVSRALRYPLLIGFAVRILAIAPSLAQPFVKAINASFEVKPTPHTPAGHLR